MDERTDKRDELIKIDDGQSTHARTAAEWIELARRDLALRSASASIPAAFIEHHKGGDNLIWERSNLRCTPLYESPIQESKASAYTDEMLARGVAQLTEAMKHPELSKESICGMIYDGMTAGLRATQPEAAEQHGDITKIEDNVLADRLGADRFVAAMKAKLYEKHLQGYSGWHNDCTTYHLEELLRKHVDKPWDHRNLVDIANFCMMLWNREFPSGGPERP